MQPRNDEPLGEPLNEPTETEPRIKRGGKRKRPALSKRERNRRKRQRRKERA